MKKIFLLLVLSTLSFKLQARTAVISDIDDTLKRTHVLGTMLGGLQFENQFTGLSSVLNGVVCDKVLCDKKRTYIDLYYVTGAPGSLGFFGNTFLKKSHFPKGNFHNRPSRKIETYDFKFEKIKHILENNDYSKVIFFGDNGQHDPEVYHDIEKLFPEIEFVTYIHQVYATETGKRERGVKVLDGQIAYLTSFDLVLDLYSKDLVNKNIVFDTFFKVEKDLYKSKKTRKNIFPKWLQCREFVRDYIKPSFTLFEISEDRLERYFSNVSNYCSTTR